jgi:hypothetical protein
MASKLLKIVVDNNELLDNEKKERKKERKKEHKLSVQCTVICF